MSLSHDPIFNPPRVARRSNDIDYLGDQSSFKGAQELADEINTYWRARGYDAGAAPVNAGFDKTMRSGYTIIRSKLVNGLPKGFKLKPKA